MKVFLLFGVLLLGNACSNGIEKIQQYDEAGNLTQEYTIRKKDQLKEGVFKEYDSEGVLISEAQYEGGRLNGERKIYDQAGKVQNIEHYKNDTLQGAFQIFYPDGSLKVEANYINGNVEGEWHTYYENGQLEERVTFVKNLENGPFIEYHPNGKLKAKGTYKDGDKEQGLLEIYDEAGTLIRKMECDQGICKTIWKVE